jgi:chromosome segregation ATPase
MDIEVFYSELDAQLKQVNRRLGTIEGKLDAQAERDHLHELKIQKLEMAFENLRGEFNEIRTAVKSIEQDINGMGQKIRDIEQFPDKKKANIVDVILEKTFNYVFSIIIAGIVAYLMVRFGIK